ncbi:histone-lysine N-methyltransferase SETMAR [Trichonephila clavipes]|nr:histone-lysine N-methyltransferase SETMAR [Trichonephila clavipes]
MQRIRLNENKKNDRFGIFRVPSPLKQVSFLPTSPWPPPAKKSAPCACSEPWVHFRENFTKQKRKAEESPSNFVREEADGYRLLGCSRNLAYSIHNAWNNNQFRSYCRKLKNLKRAIQNKRRSLLSSGVVLLHDNARPNTPVRTREVLRKFKWDVFQHPPYSPNITPSDYHLFTAMKKWLGGKHFADVEELKNAVTHLFKSQADAFYTEEIGKLVQQYDKRFFPCKRVL